jgi:hypothetical protein
MRMIGNLRRTAEHEWWETRERGLWSERQCHVKSVFSFFAEHRIGRTLSRTIKNHLHNCSRKTGGKNWKHISRASMIYCDLKLMKISMGNLWNVFRDQIKTRYFSVAVVCEIFEPFKCCLHVVYFVFIETLALELKAALLAQFEKKKKKIHEEHDARFPFYAT